MKSINLNLKDGFKNFIQKISAFAVIFIAISAILGPRIVNTVFLYKLGFFIYGGLGYIVLFMCAAFVLISRQRIMAIKKFKWGNKWFFVISSILVVAFYAYSFYVDKNYASLSSIGLTILSHIFFLSIFVSLIFGIFSFKFITYFIKGFYRELLICMVLSIVFYISMNYVWKLWPFLSDIVTFAVHNLLTLTGVHSTVVSPRKIVMNHFSVAIEEACSGVFSLFLFICIYILIVCVDWKKLNKIKAFFMFFPALIGAFLVNIIRVYLLLLVGNFISIDFAVGLFHSYIGSILFIIYFFIFMKLFYKWMKKPVKY